MEILKFHKTRQGYFIEHKNEYHFLFFFSFGKYFTDKFHSLKRIKINSSCCLNRFNHKGEREGGEDGRFVFNYGQLFAIEREKRKKKEKYYYRTWNNFATPFATYSCYRIGIGTVNVYFYGRTRFFLRGYNRNNFNQN